MSLDVLSKSKFLICSQLQEEQSPAAKKEVLGNCGSEAKKNASKRHESVPGEKESLKTIGIVKEFKNGKPAQ